MGKTGDIPPQFLPQQYSAMQNSGDAPPLSYLKEQATKKDFSFKESTSTVTNSTTKQVKNEDLTDGDVEARHGLFQRRGSLKDYLMIGAELEVDSSKAAAQSQQQNSSNLPSILDPSAILQGCKPFVSTDRPPSRTSLRATTQSPMPSYRSQYVAPKPFGGAGATAPTSTRASRPPSIPRPSSRHTDYTPASQAQITQPQSKDMSQNCIETNNTTLTNTDILTQHMEEQLIVEQKQKQMTTMISMDQSQKAEEEIRHLEEVQRQQEIQRQQELERQQEMERQREIQIQQEM